MNLVLDVGNTLVKMALFDSGKLLNKDFSDHLTLKRVRSFIGSYPVRDIIISSVAAPDQALTGRLEKEFRVVILNPETRLPVKNRYRSPGTLGTDRIACAVGASAMFPGQPVLSIDAGTCIKYDFVNARREYLGGAISPGIQMRISALHNFTARLPLLEGAKKVHFIGKDTETSMLSGVVNGAIEEVKGFIQLYADQYPQLKVVLTGGDMAYFVKPLKNRIFAAPNLVMQGLNLILEYNAEK